MLGKGNQKNNNPENNFQEEGIFSGNSVFDNDEPNGSQMSDFGQSPFENDGFNPNFDDGFGDFLDSSANSPLENLNNNNFMEEAEPLSPNNNQMNRGINSASMDAKGKFTKPAKQSKSPKASKPPKPPKAVKPPKAAKSPKPSKPPKPPKPQKVPKQSKPPKQQRQKANGDATQNGKKLPILLIVVGSLILLIIVILLIMVILGSKGTSDTDIFVENQGHTIEMPSNTDEINDNQNNDKESEQGTAVLPNSDSINNPDIDEKQNNDIVVEKDTYSFQSEVVGLRFNHAKELYRKDNITEVINTLNSVLKEDETSFNIFEDKLESTLNICKLTTNSSDGLYISISLMPFESIMETTTLKIDGSVEVEEEGIDIFEMPEEDLITEWDTQLKNSIEAMNCEIVEYGETEIKVIGDSLDANGQPKLRGIFTKMVYTGDPAVTSSTGTVDMLQCIIPVGKNAISIIAVTDGSPINIDKSVYFDEIVNSIDVMTEKPIKEVEEVEEVEDSNTEKN